MHLADDLIDAEQPCLAQMARVYEERQGSVLGVEEVEPNETDRYGIVAVRPVAPRLSQVERIVEKPKPADAPSTLAVVGRYVLTPALYPEARKHRPRRGRRDPAHGRHRGTAPR